MVLVLLCFIVPIILIEIFGLIYDYVTKVKPYKKALANLKVGNVYFLWLNTWEDNPFAVPRYLKATIKEIRYNNKGMPYVKYEFEDGSGGVLGFKSFYTQFDCKNDINN